MDVRVHATTMKITFLVLVVSLWPADRAVAKDIECASSLKIYRCTCASGPDTLSIECLQEAPLALVPSLNGAPTNRTIDLVLSTGKIQRIQQYAFRDLSLSHVDLSGNAISIIDEKAFAGMKGEIHSLKLNGNKLSLLTPTTITYFSNVTELELNQNRIGNMDFICSSSLVHLRALSLVSNKIAQIPRRCFTAMHHLEYLDLHNNDITSLKYYTFEGIEGTIKLLDLSNNNLQTIQREALRQLTSLTELKLGGNRLAGIGFLCQVRMPKLQYLTLTNNKIVKLSDQCWDDRNISFFPQLKALVLSGNKIRKINALCRAQLPKLQSLILDRNRVANISNSCFLNKRRLENLIFHTNLIESVNETYGLEQTQVKYVDFAHNFIKHIRSDFIHRLHQLRYLNLVGNIIQDYEFTCHQRAQQVVIHRDEIINGPTPPC